MEANDLTGLLWNVRGFNSAEKLREISNLIWQEKVDVAMLTETRLTKAIWIDSMHICQTMYQKKGGCLTGSTASSHKRVKLLGTYMSWSKIQTPADEVQLVTCYVEPGDTEVTRERTEKIVAIVQDMIR